jgi:hypothetical protein
MSYSLSLPLEGNRRIEGKFSDDMICALQDTLQRAHSQSAYARALLAIARLYLKLVDRVTNKFRVSITRRESDGVRSVLAQHEF